MNYKNSIFVLVNNITKKLNIWNTYISRYEKYKNKNKKCINIEKHCDALVLAQNISRDLHESFYEKYEGVPESENTYCLQFYTSFRSIKPKLDFKYLSKEYAEIMAANMLLNLKNQDIKIDASDDIGPFIAVVAPDGTLIIPLKSNTDIASERLKRFFKNEIMENNKK